MSGRQHFDLNLLRGARWVDADAERLSQITNEFTYGSDEPRGLGAG
jgi:hypothetical protein